MANFAATCRRLADYVAIRSAGQAALALAAAVSLTGVGVWWLANGGSHGLSPMHEPRARAAAGVPVKPQPARDSKTLSGNVLININTAGADELDRLPGIGPKIAQNIIDYRTEHGEFETIDELDNVSRIGAKTLADIRPLVCVK